MLYLLDEILQGTNSVERHLAVARVLAHLVEKGAIGAVSTHDLELAKSPELADCCRVVHFRETLHDAASGRQMTFDYRLRPGLATTTNALKLLELVGLVEPEPRLIVQARLVRPIVTGCPPSPGKVAGGSRRPSAARVACERPP